VALPLLVGAIVMALKVMPAKGTSWLVHLDVGLAWFSALSAMVLVPTDVSTTLEVRQNYSHYSKAEIRTPLQGTARYLVADIDLWDKEREGSWMRVQH
jgi:hypothetical protein